ncbi:MAG: FIST N-terminal domain-containing protein [Candidatus Hydrothermales bacterium]
MKKIMLLSFLCFSIVMAGTVGYGWSVNPDVKKAVEEATKMISTKMKLDEIEFLFVFSTVDYGPEKVYSEIRKKIKKAKIYGGTSCSAVMTPDGFHTSKHGAIAMMAIKSEKIKFTTGYADLDKMDAFEAGKTAISMATKERGQPSLVFITAAPGKEEDIIRGIESVIGKTIPIIGGSSADNDITGKWAQFTDVGVLKNGVSLACIYTDKKIGWAFEAGYKTGIAQGKVTSAKGRTIYTIDNKPAAEVYNFWLGGKLDDVLQTGGNVLERTTFHPLAKIVKGPRGEVYFISIHPLSINLPEKSLTVFTEINEGEELTLFEGDWEILLRRAATTPRVAYIRGDFTSPKEIEFGIFTYCAGTMLAIPEKERPKMVDLVKSVVGNAPFLGTFTFGEQGFLPAVGNIHGNLVSSMVLVRE